MTEPPPQSAAAGGDAAEPQFGDAGHASTTRTVVSGLSTSPSFSTVMGTNVSVPSCTIVVGAVALAASSGHWRGAKANSKSVLWWMIGSRRLRARMRAWNVVGRKLGSRGSVMFTCTMRSSPGARSTVAGGCTLPGGADELPASYENAMRSG